MTLAAMSKLCFKDCSPQLGKPIYYLAGAVCKEVDLISYHVHDRPQTCQTIWTVQNDNKTTT